MATATPEYKGSFSRQAEVEGGKSSILQAKDIVLVPTMCQAPLLGPGNRKGVLPVTKHGP